MAMDNHTPFALLVLVIVTTSGHEVTFMQQPQDTKAVVGSNVFFPCTYNGTRGVPRWIINQTSHVVSRLPLGHSYNGTGLMVHGVDVFMNETQYQCCFKIHTGRGVFERICSSAGMLFVSAGFVEYPIPVQTAPGELGRFQCTAVATSVCAIQWRINHTIMIDSEADAYSIPLRIERGILSSTLHVLAVPQHNNSEVQCCAYNDIGSEEICTNPVNLTITGVQSKPGAPTISSILSTSSSLTINIQLSPEGIPPIHSIAVNFTSPAGHVRSIPGPFSPGQLVTANLSDLETETEYIFTLFAVNFNGLSPASDQANATTVPNNVSTLPIPNNVSTSLIAGITSGVFALVLCVCCMGLPVLVFICSTKHRVPKNLRSHDEECQVQSDSGTIQLDCGFQSHSGREYHVKQLQHESSPYLKVIQEQLQGDQEQVQYESSPFRTKRNIHETVTDV